MTQGNDISGEKLNFSHSVGEATERIDVRIEKEKMSIERESLALERERVQALLERLRIEREWSGDSDALHVGIGILGLAVAVALVLGAVIGYRTGFDSGFLRNPRPRKVVIGKKVVNMLAITLPDRRKTGYRYQDSFDWYATITRISRL